MGSPAQTVTLTAEQLKDLHSKLANMRHDINNTLSLIVAAAELMRFKPETVERMTATLMEQPNKVTASINQFSAEFERVLGITRS